MMKSVLFVAYGGGHVAMLAPIAKALLARGLPFTFLALTTARAAVERLGIPSIGFRDLPEATDVESQRWARELASELSLSGSVEPEETLAYHGASYRDLVDEYGVEEAHQRFAVAGRQSFLPVSTLRRVMERLKPSLVIATNSPRAERAAFLAAGQLGIPSICTVDLFAKHEVQWIGQPGYGTRICVLNDSVRNMFLLHGRKPDEVIVTGNPAFDVLTCQETIEAGKQLRSSKGWEDGRKVVLWASQVEPERHPFADRVGDPSLPRRVENALRHIVDTNSGLRLVVRYHPSECVSFESAPRVDFSPVSEPISVLLHAVDAVVVTASTVGLQAAIAGRPVVSVDMSIFTPDSLLSDLGVSEGITNLKLLGSALSKALARNSAGFTQEKSDMTATKAVLGVIDSLLV